MSAFARRRQCVALFLLENCHTLPLLGCLSGSITILSPVNVWVGHQHLLSPSHLACMCSVQDRQRTCLSTLGWDQRFYNKTAQVWQKCSLSRSWSPLDGAKFGIKRSNDWSSSLYISQQATNDLMDEDFYQITLEKQQGPTCQPRFMLNNSCEKPRRNFHRKKGEQKKTYYESSSFSNQMNKLCHVFASQPLIPCQPFSFQQPADS